MLTGYKIFCLALALGTGSIFLSCDGGGSLDSVLDEAPAVCEEMCWEYISCEFNGMSYGTSQLKAEGDAVDACIAVCYWATDRGIYTYSEVGSQKQIERNVSGSNVRSYLECLDTNGFFRCSGDDFSIRASQLTESGCQLLSQCYNELEISGQVVWGEVPNSYFVSERCYISGDEHLWPDILNLWVVESDIYY